MLRRHATIAENQRPPRYFAICRGAATIRAVDAADDAHVTTASTLPSNENQRIALSVTNAAGETE